MKFYGHGIVWDSERDCVLCDFVDGVVETTDERIIAVLKRMNLDCEEDEVTDYEKFSVSELKEILDERNIKYTTRANKEELIILLKGVE